MNHVKKEVLLREYKEKLQRRYVVLERGDVHKLVRRYHIGPFKFDFKVRNNPCGLKISPSECKFARGLWISFLMKTYEKKISFKYDAWKEVV